MAGNNVDDAKELIATSEVNKRIVSEDDFGRAAKLVSYTQHKINKIIISLQAAKFANK